VTVLRRDPMGLFLRSLGLALMWGALWGDLGAGTLLAGVGVALGVQLVFPGLAPQAAGRVAPIALLRLVAVFTWMLVVANLSVVRRVLAPTITIDPGVVDVDLPPCSDAVVTVVANAVTLTPGTLTLDVQRTDDGVQLLVHNLDAGDPDGVRADVRRLYDLVAAAFPAGAAGDPATTPRPRSEELT
jgi:multicomponent Na+:H+ antiporter subunit E